MPSGPKGQGTRSDHCQAGSNLLVAAGADRVVTMDLHASQIQGYFDIPVDHLVGMPILSKYFTERDLEDVVIVSPDHGSVTRARNMAQPLECTDRYRR